MKFESTEGIEYKVIFRKPDKRTWGEGCDGVCFYPENGKNNATFVFFLLFAKNSKSRDSN